MINKAKRSDDMEEIKSNLATGIIFLYWLDSCTHSCDSNNYIPNKEKVV